MKLFKDFKTKRQLREEIAELKSALFSQHPKLDTVEREVQKVSSDIVFNNNEQTEYIKEQIAHEMIEFLKPLIEWILKMIILIRSKKRIRGNIYLAKKK